MIYLLAWVAAYILGALVSAYVFGSVTKDPFDAMQMLIVWPVALPVVICYKIFKYSKMKNSDDAYLRLRKANDQQREEIKKLKEMLSLKSTREYTPYR